MWQRLHDVAGKYAMFEKIANKKWMLDVTNIIWKVQFKVQKQ